MSSSVSLSVYMHRVSCLAPRSAKCSCIWAPSSTLAVIYVSVLGGYQSVISSSIIIITPPPSVSQIQTPSSTSSVFPVFPSSPPSPLHPPAAEAPTYISSHYTYPPFPRHGTSSCVSQQEVYNPAPTSPETLSCPYSLHQ